MAALGILLARTDPDVAKHRGISYFVCPMDAPGVHHPAHRRHDRRPRLQRGVPGRGPPARRPIWWARSTAAGRWPRSRWATSGCRCRARARCGARAPPSATWSTPCAAPAGVRDAVLRQRLARLWMEGEVLRLIRLRTVSAAVAGRAPGPEASVRKALADDHGQRVMELAQAVAGPYGLLADAGPAEGLAGGAPVTAARRVDGAVAGVGRGPRATCSPGRSPSAAAPPRCSATSSPSGCSGFPMTSTSRPAGPGRSRAAPFRPEPAARAPLSDAARADGTLAPRGARRRRRRRDG